MTTAKGESPEVRKDSYKPVPDLISDEESYTEMMSIFNSVYDENVDSGQVLEYDESEISEEQTVDELLEEEDEEPGIHKDDIYELLKNPRRRAVLRYLHEFSEEEEDPVDLGTLSEEIAAYENEKTVETITSDERKNVYIPLYQSHLDKLEDVELVEYNQDRNLIDRGPKFDVATDHIEDEFYAEDQRVYGNKGLFSKILDKIPSKYNPISLLD